ncbi:hypothetical protein J6590_104718, partial [Homalodisca vitripennis]
WPTAKDVGLEDRDFWFEEANAALKRCLSLQSRRQSAINVVLLVGDGLGLATLTAARIFKGQRQAQPGESSHLAWEKFSAVALAKSLAVAEPVNRLNVHTLSCSARRAAYQQAFIPTTQGFGGLVVKALAIGTQDSEINSSLEILTFCKTATQ